MSAWGSTCNKTASSPFSEGKIKQFQNVSIDLPRIFSEDRKVERIWRRASYDAEGFSGCLLVRLIELRGNVKKKTISETAVCERKSQINNGNVLKRKKVGIDGTDITRKGNLSRPPRTLREGT